MELREGTDEDDEDFQECEDKDVTQMPILEENHVVTNCDNQVVTDPDKDLSEENYVNGQKSPRKRVEEHPNDPEATAEPSYDQRKLSE